MGVSRKPPAVLDVRLGQVHVGAITLEAYERTEFVFSEEYRQRYPRPVLSQSFEDNPFRRVSSRIRLPAFFSNLLPEGPLRELLAKQEGIHPEREFLLLARLGQDLPGAVVVTPASELEQDEVYTAGEEADVTLPVAEGLHFSLAGVQLKFSMMRRDRGLTLPATGQDGDWIAKLPDNRYERVPENEFAMMTWARAAGIEVPPFELIPIEEMHGLPEGVTLSERLAYAIRRFDRPEPGRRVHMEDLAQVLGVYASEKYDKANYETIAKILLNVVGKEGLREFIRRLVFIVASGNADAHLKNWSLLYPDGVTAILSPAYDMVSTLQYIPQDTLALNFARSKKFEDVSVSGFERLARLLKLARDEVITPLQEAVDAVLDAWQVVRADLPLEESFKERIEARWQEIPLLQSRLTTARK